jgi:hypothetical protein
MSAQGVCVSSGQDGYGCLSVAEQRLDAVRGPFADWLKVGDRWKWCG